MSCVEERRSTRGCPDDAPLILVLFVLLVESRSSLLAHVSKCEQQQKRHDELLLLCCCVVVGVVASVSVHRILT